MVAKFALFFAAIATLATATPLTPAGRSTSATAVSQCDTGTAKCCNSVQSTDDESFSKVLGLVGLSDVEGLVGLGCTAIGASACTQQPVCCEGNTFHGLVNVGCSPLAL